MWWAPAQTPAEVVVDPQLIVNHGFVAVEGDGTGGDGARSMAGPVTFSGVSPPARTWVPALGEHTDEVLATLAQSDQAPT